MDDSAILRVNGIDWENIVQYLEYSPSPNAVLRLLFLSTQSS